MTQAVAGLITDLCALEEALRAEKMDAVANLIRGFIRDYHKNNGPEAGMDWGKAAAQLDRRAAAMHRENDSLPPAARNTPFGVMTGTATIILSMMAEALDAGRGIPPKEDVDAIIAKIQSDRGAFVLAKLGLKPGTN